MRANNANWYTINEPGTYVVRRGILSNYTHYSPNDGVPSYFIDNN